MLSDEDITIVYTIYIFLNFLFQYRCLGWSYQFLWCPSICINMQYSVKKKKKRQKTTITAEKNTFSVTNKNIIITVLKTRHFLICFSRNTITCLVYLLSIRKQDNGIGNRGEAVIYFNVELPPCFSRCLPLLKSLILGKTGAAEVWAAFLKLVS